MSNGAKWGEISYDCGECDAGRADVYLPNCGASQTFDPSQRSLVCPFCGTPVVLDQARATPAAALPPDRRFIVPLFLVLRK